MTMDLNNPTPEDHLYDPSSACSEMSPDWIVGHVRQLLGWHFADPNNIRAQRLRHYIWRPATKPGGANPESKILIETVHKYESTKTDKRPAILLRDEGCAVNYPGIGNNSHQGFHRIEGIQSEHTLLWEGKLTVMAAAMDSGESGVLAWEVCSELAEFAPIVAKLPRMMKFRVVGYGKKQKFEECREHFGVAINIEYAFQSTFTLVPHAPKLKRIEAENLTACEEALVKYL